jgi:hypothetical protein
MSLTDWLNQGLLRKHTSSPEEISELLHLVDRDLQQCKVEGLADMSGRARFPEVRAWKF